MIRENIPLFADIMAKHPWLWGVTSRWFPTDEIRIETLTPETLKELKYSTMMDQGGSSWHIYQRLQDGTEQVENAGRYGTRHGTPIARVIRREAGVQYLIQAEWIDLFSEKAYRRITLYRVPQSGHGATLRALCVKALQE